MSSGMISKEFYHKLVFGTAAVYIAGLFFANQGIPPMASAPTNGIHNKLTPPAKSKSSVPESPFRTLDSIFEEDYQGDQGDGSEPTQLPPRKIEDTNIYPV